MFTNVGGLTEQSMTRLDCVSSDMALHREAAVESCCWDNPCKLAALMNLQHNSSNTDLTDRKFCSENVVKKVSFFGLFYTWTRINVYVKGPQEIILKLFLISCSSGR